MLYQFHETIVQQHAVARWKEWIPLTSQQVSAVLYSVIL